MAKTNPIQRALQLRETLVVDGKVLVADFSGTLQGKDTSRVVDLMPIVGTKHYPFRTKVNVKGLDPLASKEYGADFFDLADKTDDEIEAFVRKQEFDFPLWFKHERQFSMRQIPFYNLPFILQIAGCNFHDGSCSGGCWYCFVDDQSNDGISGRGKTLLGIDETIDSMLAAREKVRRQYSDAGYEMDLRVLRTSGGEPTIALDWILNLWREIGNRGLDFVGHLDSNLSTARVVEDFERRGIYEENILEKLAEHPVKVLTALKGVDEENLQDNVQSETTLEDQKHSLIKFVNAGFEIFPMLYNPNPATLRAYLERMDSSIENFSLRIHISPIKVYGPTIQRLSLGAQRQSVDPQVFIEQQKRMWDSNYREGCEILDSYLRVRYGVGYKETTRADVKIRVR
jgi:uncharacterized Fe-S cluster-containing radical SAM superfamily protein